jgi:hypothetical protein
MGIFGKLRIFGDFKKIWGNWVNFGKIFLDIILSRQFKSVLNVLE